MNNSYFTKRMIEIIPNINPTTCLKEIGSMNRIEELTTISNIPEIDISGEMIFNGASLKIKE